MTDLLNELQRLSSSVCRHTDASGSVAPRMVQANESDPLLLDEVYSVSPTTSLSGAAGHSSGASTAADRSVLRVTWRSEIPPVSSACRPANQALPNSSTVCSSAACSTVNSPAVAAVAAYRRQHLGLGSNLPATGTPVQPSSAKPAYTLKSRPAGKLVPEYGPQHILGYLPKVAADSSQLQPAVPNLPAKSGTGQPLPPARLQPSSCCPPPDPEPLVPMSPDAKLIIAEHLAERLLDPASLSNRLVYDSLEPPSTSLDSNSGWPFDNSNSASGSSSGVSSCRTTRSTASAPTSRSNSTLRDEPDGPAAAQGSSAIAPERQYAPGLSSWYTPQGPDDSTLVFESRFECGNLRRAVQVQPFEYDLVLQPDLNTRGHTQWYFFAVSNTRAGQAYRFNIINLLKEDSLYNMGMLPLMHSEQHMQSKGVGWFRTGSEVYYGPNSIKRGKQTYYTLTFLVDFPFSNDWVHLAHCYPYSYTDLQHQLYVICKEPSIGFAVERSCLAISLAGNPVDVLTITAAASEGKPLSQRQGVVLSARVHPGETNASWMMQGALQQLLGNSADSKQLRENFVFKVAPMLNPDGVIVGNYRCSLAGLDLNRVWQDPDSRIQPVIWAYKGMIKAFTEEREVAMFCDMHGHSRKYGVFIYGCEKKAGKDSTSQAPGWPVPGTVGGLPGIPVKCQPNIFPLMLYLNAPDLFSYKSCNFKVQKSKAGTGRVVGFRELGLVNAFTIEASFCGAAVGRYAKQHYNTGHLEDMGAALVRTLLDYWAPADTNSAPDLAAQLTGSAGSGAAGAVTAGQSALGLLLDAAAGGEDDDVCTDSDDESSDDETPPQPSPSSRAASAKRLDDTAVIITESSEDSAAAAKLAATISNHVAELSNEVVAVLTGTRSGDGSRSAAADRQFGSTESAAASPVSALLSALQQQQEGSKATARGSPASSAAVRSSRSNSRIQSSSNLVGQQQQQQQQPNLNPLPAATTAVLTAADAAQQLLQKLKGGSVRRQPSGSSGTASPRKTDSLRSRSSTSSSRRLTGTGSPVSAGFDAVCGGSATTAQQPVLYNNKGRRSTGSSLEIGVGSQQQQQQQQAVLTQEEAALASMPGFVDLLQELVDEQAALSVAVATAAVAAGSSAAAQKGGKKKGRRRQMARYGNPEVLRAARAKADATLAAALPALGILGDDIDAAAQGDSAGDDDDSIMAAGAGMLAGPLPAPASAGSDGSRESQNPVRLITSGRRANTSLGRSSKSSMLDAERYMTLLDKQKRHTGGVLASSSIDDPWEGLSEKSSSRSPFSRGALMSPQGGSSINSAASWGSPVSAVTRSATAGGSGAVGSHAEVATGSLRSAAAGGQGAAGANAVAEAAHGRRRRSKSAQPCLQDAGLWQRVEAAVQADALADSGLLSGT